MGLWVFLRWNTKRYQILILNEYFIHLMSIKVKMLFYEIKICNEKIIYKSVYVTILSKQRLPYLEIWNWVILIRIYNYGVKKPSIFCAIIVGLLIFASSLRISCFKVLSFITWIIVINFYKPMEFCDIIQN